VSIPIGLACGGPASAAVSWTAAHDERIKCVAAQVPGMGVIGAVWYAMGMQRGTQQARGEAIESNIEPIPRSIDSVEGLYGTPHAAKMTQYDAVKAAPPDQCRDTVRSPNPNPAFGPNTVCSPATR